MCIRDRFAIGDPDQSIYSFRGGEAKCFQKLEEDFPHVCRISLEENYRSAPQILNNALSVISKNPGEERKLKATAKDGKKVKVVTAGSPMKMCIRDSYDPSLCVIVRQRNVFILFLLK